MLKFQSTYQEMISEEINRSKYKEFINKIGGEMGEKTTKFWSMYGPLYKNVIKNIKSVDELNDYRNLNPIKLIKPTEVKNINIKDFSNAYNMFLNYKEDVLNGVLEEQQS